MKIQRFAWIGLGATLVGCGELSAFVDPGTLDEGDWDTGSPATDEQPGTDDPSDDTPQPDEPESCTFNGFTPAVSQTTLDDANPSQSRLVHRSVNVAAYPNDEFQLVSFQGAPYYGPSEPGNYDVADLNMSDCGLCVVLLADCSETSCRQTFFPRSGTVSVLALDGVGSNFSIVMRDVVMEEVTVDPSTYVSTPVAGGDTWCLDNVRIDDPYILPAF